jgi:hypothetical protein
MDLIKIKQLHVVTHSGADKGINSCIHTKQTNPGYSRNTLGGVYTKWSVIYLFIFTNFLILK